ncbi:MAG: hypothetical protein VCD00_17660, partial [Candidatus Hydrogenedentota bacterium]
MSTDNTDDGEGVTERNEEGGLSEPLDSSPDNHDDDPDVSLGAMTSGQRPVIAKEPIDDPEVLDRLMHGAEIIQDSQEPATEEAPDDSLEAIQGALDLLISNRSDESAEDAQTPPVQAEEPEAAPDGESDSEAEPNSNEEPEEPVEAAGLSAQDDLDALISGISREREASEAEEPVEESASSSQDELDALIAGISEETEESGAE